MAFENSQAFTIESKRKVDTKQFESTCRLEVPSDKPIRKIISVNALPKIASHEKVGESISFSGKTSYQVVYETEEGKLASAFASVEWQDKLDGAVEAYYLECLAIENVVTGFSSTEIAFSTLLNIELYEMASDKVTPVVGLTDDYVTSEKAVEYERVVNTINETFTEVSEQEVNYKLQDVLSYNADVRLKNATCGIDTISLEGEILVDVIALEDDNIVKLAKTIDFRQEMASLSVVPNNQVDAKVSLSDIKVTASVSDIDSKTNLIISLELQAEAVVYSKESVTVIEDAFSIKKEIVSTGECVTFKSYEGDGYYEDTISGNFDTSREVDLLCYVNSANALVSDVIEGEEGTTFNGGIEVEAVCETESKEKVKLSGIVPFSITVPELKNSDVYQVKVKVNSSKLRGQKEIEAVLDIYVEYKKYQTNYITFLSSIEELEEKQASLSAIKVYVVGHGEDLFSVAKAISVRPEDIVNQNPNIESGLSEGTRLVVYSPLDINF